MKNILFNLKNKDFDTRVIVLDYLRKQLSTGKYYSGRYENPKENVEEYFRFEQGVVEIWYKIPLDLFENFTKQVFKDKNGSNINIKIGRTIYLQEDAHTDNPKYYKSFIDNYSITLNPNLSINYNRDKKQVWKMLRADSLLGFNRIKNNRIDNNIVFDFTSVDKFIDTNQHI
jgi:hypothetical protein